MYKIVGADSREYGPATAELIREWIALGRANGETMVQSEGATEWKPLSTFPEFAEALAAKASAGLFDLLEGPARLSSVLFSGSKTTFSFLPLGKATRLESQNPQPAEILQKLKEPARAFDLVIIDCGSVSADAYVQPFADISDEILFVVRAGVTRKDEILSAFEALHLNSRKIRGTILAAASEDYA